MSKLVWVSKNGREQNIKKMHSNHLVNAIKSLYNEAQSNRAAMRKTPISRRTIEVKKRLASTKGLTGQEYAHWVFPQLDTLLREAWRRGLVKAPE